MREETLVSHLTRHRCLAAFAMVLALAVPALAGAQATTAASGPPAGFKAPAEPQPDETNAQRAKSQPGNNAPFWRGVHDSGTQAGITSLPGASSTRVRASPTPVRPGARCATTGSSRTAARSS
jgi:formate dehydrogenase subunit gamma